MRTQKETAMAQTCRRIALGLAGATLALTSACAVDTAGPESMEQESLAVTSPYFQNLHLDEKDCRRITVYFDRVSKFNNRPIRSFRLYRDGEVVNTVVPNMSKGPAIQISVGDGWFFPGTGQLNRYRVEVENDAGETGLSNLLTHRANVCPDPGQSFVIVKLTPSDLAPYPEIAANGKVKDLLASPTSDRSVYSYYKEASYGAVQLSFVEEPGWLNVGMTHAQFCGGAANINTDETNKRYCASGYAKTSAAIKAVKGAIASKYPGRKVIWVFNGMYGGAAVAAGDIDYGALEVSYGDLRGVMHEMGHYFFLTEGWGLNCPTASGWFGPSLTGIPGPRPPSGCYFWQYGLDFDPMGARSGSHFYGIHKYQMGWLNFAKNVKTQYSLWPGGGALMTLKAVDDPVLSTSTQFSDYRLGRYQLETNGHSYLTLEYRRNVGMNAVSYPDSPALVDGVYLTLFPGHNPTSFTSEDDDTSGLYGDVLAPRPEGTTEPAITMDRPFVDADRQLRISLESIDAVRNQATIKIKKLYSYTGSCVTAKDVAHYVSAGYACLCNRQIGAFVDRTASTIECRPGIEPTR